eukprot:1873725-Prymnesium_polylepis.1
MEAEERERLKNEAAAEAAAEAKAKAAAAASALELKDAMRTFVTPSCAASHDHQPDRTCPAWVTFSRASAANAVRLRRSIEAARHCEAFRRPWLCLLLQAATELEDQLREAEWRRLIAAQQDLAQALMS